jgi:very-short-patch-repair endonuclease
MNKNPFTDPALLQRAREMRREPTEPERRLWQKVRRKQLDGYKFRRQHPIGRFILDFYCHEARLVVELDGESHAFQEEYDAARTEWLEAQGLRVLRFPNHVVMKNMEGVLETILMACRRSDES